MWLDYAIKEKPLQVEDMQGGPDYIVLKSLDTDGIRIIGSVLGQSIALDYFVSQVNMCQMSSSFQYFVSHLLTWRKKTTLKTKAIIFILKEAIDFLAFALSHYQVDGLVEEFAGINRGMEKTGTFTMDKKKLLQLVGKANSNLADVILKVGLFERYFILVLEKYTYGSVRIYWKFKIIVIPKDFKYLIYQFISS